jgi:hypothetical protein
MAEYTVRLIGTEEAKSPEDAVRQYVGRLVDNSAGMQVDDVAVLTSTGGFITFYSTSKM